MRKIFRIPAAVLLFSLFAAALFPAAAAAEADPRVAPDAEAAALYEPETGRFLFRKNAERAMPMASTTKIMTAIVALAEYDPDRPVSIDPRAVGIEGSSLYLTAGEILTMRELLYGLLLRSANDAAEAIAYAVAGGIPAFADKMNETARRIGAEHTHFANPHGLDAEEHYTTAEDLARIAAYALDDPLFCEIVSTEQIRIENKDGLVRLLTNHNKLLRLYDGCIGVKTGYTKQSGRCLVSAAERNGLRMIAVTLDAPDDWNDHRAMLDLGYSLLQKHVLAKAGGFSYVMPVVGGKKSAVALENPSAFSMITDAKDHLFSSDVRLSRYFVAPIRAGEELGEVVFYRDGEEIGRIPLCATENVAKAEKSGRRGLFR